MTRLHKPPRIRNYGHTAAEFGIVGSLVLGASLIAIGVLGHSIGDLLKQSASANTTQTMNLLAPKYANASVDTGKKIQIITNKGTTITVDAALENNLGKIVLTSGANGATKLMADQITAMAEQLKASGEITATQYNALIELANQGHNLANIEQQFETIVATSPSGSVVSDRVLATPSLLEGDPNAKFVYYTIGYSGSSSDNPLTIPDPLDTSHAVWTTQRFLMAYDTAVSSGALNDPSVKSVIDALSSNIGYLSSLVGATTGQITFDQISPNQQTATMAAQLTHEDSGGICKVGSGTDSGLHCSATPSN